MGTDITFFAEQQAADGTWHLADEPVESPYYNPDYPETAALPQIIPREIDLGRIYALFAILADIRNGVRCEEPFVPLSEPRGLPDDLSDIGRRYFDSWDGAYGGSWLTPSEIEAYNWSQIIQRRAMVAPEAAHLFENNPLGFPSEKWPKGIEVSCAVWKRDGVTVRWRETYAEAARLDHFRKAIEPYLGSSSCRFVFWFDS